MTTARDIVTYALKRIHIVAPGESPAAEDAADALEVLNDYVLSMSEDDMDLVDLAGNAYTYTSLTLNDTWPFANGLDGAFKSVLAFKLTGHFGKSADAELLRAYSAGMNRIDAAFQPDMSQEPDTTLLFNHTRIYQ